jgi:hypothetical protein
MPGIALWPNPPENRYQEEEDARIVAERNARSRARFGRSASHD